MPEPIETLLSKHGIYPGELYRAKGQTKKGRFRASTYKELIDKIGESCQDYISSELIEEKVFIRYSIATACTYKMNGTDFVPNGAYENDSDWINGNYSGTFSSDPLSYGFNVYAVPYVKQTFKYKSGKTFEKEISITYYKGDIEIGPNAKWLHSIVRQTPLRNATIKEIEYTEEVAGVFVSMYKSIFAINEKVKNFTEPEQIKILASKNQKLIS